MKAGICKIIVACAACAGVFISVPAQEGAEHAAEPGRGDVHSPGWKKVQELKGPPVSPRFPALGDEIHRHVLDNGLTVYLREDHELPLIRAELLVKAGSYYEAAEQIGLASLTAEQMPAGGTQKLSASALTDRLAFLAASINAFAGAETARVSLDVLSSYAGEGLALFADVIRRPAFDDERIELARRNLLFQLRHRNDAPQQVLQRELSKVLFTAEHPRGRETRPEHVAGLSRDALVAFHKRFFVPDRAYLAVVGDFERDAMLKQIGELFGSWESHAETLPGLPVAKAQARPGIYVVDRDLNQSSIAVVHWGIDRTNKDRYAVDLMNAVLGGGSFSSRITERVRSDEGLAYSARSRYPTDGREVDLFEASVQTKTETTVQAVRLIIDEIKKMQTGKISQNEFDTAQESQLYSYVFRFDDPVQNVVRLMELELEGLPADYYQQQFKGYQAVSPASMSKAAGKYLRPDDLTIFIVGKLAGFREELAQLGKVNVIELEEFNDAGAGEGGRGGTGGPGRRGQERPQPGGSGS